MATPASRFSGILAHISALPGPMGCGEFGSDTIEFLNLLKSAGQRLWQVLPLGPTDTAPYSAKSSFAMHPVYISLQSLAEEFPFLVDQDKVTDLLSKSKEHSSTATSDTIPEAVGISRFVDFDKVWSLKSEVLKQASLALLNSSPSTTASTSTADTRAATNAIRLEFEQFCGEHGSSWLDHYSLFAVIDAHMRSEGGPNVWNEWPEPLRSCGGVLSDEQKQAASIKNDDIHFHKFLQFIAYRQWNAIRKVAHNLDVAIIGDCAIYPSMHSADVWANTEIFEIDSTTKLPSAVAGVPPDYFSEDGQLWGNPVYNWAKLESTDFNWWCERMRVTLLQVDLLRIDHFRGLEAYYAVPYEHATTVRNARVGEWKKAKGLEMLTAVVKRLHGEHTLLGTSGTGKRPSLNVSGEPPTAKKAKLDPEGACKPVTAATPPATCGSTAGATSSSMLSALRVVSPPYIVEDLGFITDEVKQLTAHFGFPNMKVVQFAFGGGATGTKSYCENDHLPHSFKVHSVVYPGTHDNATAVGWWDSADQQTKENFADYCGCSGKVLDSVEANRKLQALCMQSVSGLCVTPLQDILNLNDREGRFNNPANGSWPQNWRWQLSCLDPLKTHLPELHTLTLATGRAWSE